MSLSVDSTHARPFLQVTHRPVRLENKAGRSPAALPIPQTPEPSQFVALAWCYQPPNLPAILLPSGPTVTESFCSFGSGNRAVG